MEGILYDLIIVLVNIYDMFLSAGIYMQIKATFLTKNSCAMCHHVMFQIAYCNWLRFNLCKQRDKN